MQPSVTAVITTHARPRHVREALASLRREEYGEIELILVEDRDEPDERVNAISPPEVPGLRVLTGYRLGVGRARNIGLAAASGELVIFLDDDDVALPARISTLVAAANRFDADLCFGLTRRVGPESESNLPAVPTHVMRFGSTGFCDLLACAPHINSVLARTAALRAVGGFDSEANHFDDWAAWLRLADRGMRIACVGEVVAEWRIHSSGLSGIVTRAGAMKERILELFDRLMPELSVESVRALAVARRTVATREINTYDDYAREMREVRDQLHAAGGCLGRRQVAHHE